MMRTPEYLSPSSISLYKQDPREFYVRYLTNKPPGRDPQTKPMAVGSAFDAMIKAYLYKNLIGGNDPRFDEEELFNAQVDKVNQEWAWKNGRYVFEQYKQSGALVDLMILLKESPAQPRFEFEIRGTKHGYREGKEGQFGEVVLLGKPDVDFFIGNVHVILDFKVNGYCGFNQSFTPKPYYLRLRSAGKTNHGKHKNCYNEWWNGVEINTACFLEDVDESWARQLAIYAWLCGEPIGSEFITIVHQIACSYNKNGLPGIKVAEHVNKISPKFQQQIFDDAVNLWELVHSDHFFRDLSKADSDALCKLLDERQQAINHPLYSLCR